MPSKLKTVFFGTPEFAVLVLEEMEMGGIRPDLIVTNPDEPKGRKLIITPPPVKDWARKRNIPVIQPENFKVTPPGLDAKFDLFIVVAYGKIIPEAIINIPKYGTINVHPSLLPKYRGASPIQTAILNSDTETGVSIMLLDKEMDHGPVIAQEKINLSEKLYLPELRERLAKIAGNLLVKVIPDWVDGKIEAKTQDHTKASFTKKIERNDGYIDPTSLLEAELHGARAEDIERMVRALNPDPGVFTYLEIGNPDGSSVRIVGASVGTGRKLRIKITRAKVEDGKLIIEKIIPEGKKEMSWADFRRGNKF